MVVGACLAMLTAGCGSVSAPAPPGDQGAEATQPAKEQSGATQETAFPSPHGLPITVKEIGPTQAMVDLQVVTLFNQASKQAFSESMVELNDSLGGFVSAVRDSGQFQANALETLLITPPPGSIGARRLLIVGLGDSSQASLDLMKKVGAVVAREAVRERATSVAFAPTLRDQSFNKLDTGEVGAAVVEGAIPAYDTELRLQQQALDGCFAIKHLYYEAGAAYYSDVVQKVAPAVKEATAQVNQRSDEPFGKTGPQSKKCRI
ncbi:M17 family peptidase N-terminal domain-containing protein [Streptomyces sp. NBC_01727]|uniref:M17 family peptidase N-terminal domain-containing protein n=1 Tax=unclassified Streptomyces TaxID=2593676 RepID=UPI002E127807|nr:hypothetical protein OIE76_39680 [Streptomyces sp. NBC_01727]